MSDGLACSWCRNSPMRRPARTVTSTGPESVSAGSKTNPQRPMEERRRERLPAAGFRGRTRAGCLVQFDKVPAMTSYDAWKLATPLEYEWEIAEEEEHYRAGIEPCVKCGGDSIDPMPTGDSSGEWLCSACWNRIHEISA